MCHLLFAQLLESRHTQMWVMSLWPALWRHWEEMSGLWRRRNLQLPNLPMCLSTLIVWIFNLFVSNSITINWKSVEGVGLGWNFSHVRPSKLVPIQGTAHFSSAPLNHTPDVKNVSTACLDKFRVFFPFSQTLKTNTTQFFRKLNLWWLMLLFLGFQKICENSKKVITFFFGFGWAVQPQLEDFDLHPWFFLQLNISRYEYTCPNKSERNSLHPESSLPRIQ